MGAALPSNCQLAPTHGELFSRRIASRSYRVAHSYKFNVIQALEVRHVSLPAAPAASNDGDPQLSPNPPKEGVGLAS